MEDKILQAIDKLATDMNGLKTAMQENSEVLSHIQEYIVKMDAKIDGIDKRLLSLENKVNSFEVRLGSLENKFDSFSSEMRGSLRMIEKELTEIKDRLGRLEKRTIEDSDAHAEEVVKLQDRVKILEQKVAQLQAAR